MTESAFQRGIQMNDIGSDHRCGNPHNDQIIPQFFVLKHCSEIPHQKQIEHVEVNTEQQHENRNDVFKIWTVISGDTAVFNGETASTRCGEGMVCLLYTSRIYCSTFYLRQKWQSAAE